MKMLDWLDVGPVSAERDKNLQHYFFDAGVSQSIVSDPTRFLFLGRKGAGKTAVFLHLKQRPVPLFGKNDIMVPFSPSDYSWSAHAALGDAQKSGGGQFKTSWRFVMAIECVKALSQCLDANNVTQPKPLKRATAVLERLFDSPIPSWFELMKQKLFRLSKLKLPSGGIPSDGGISIEGGEISFGDVKNDNALQEALTRSVDALTRFLEDALKESTSGYRIFLLFDRMDENWLAKSLDECKQMIGGLIQAGEHFAQRFDGTIRPIIFLREDVFDSLDTINDPNKLRHDCSRTLKWSEDSLNALVLARINYFAKLQGVMPLSKSSDIFKEPALSTKVSPTKHIYERTFSRPRDLVAYYKKIIETAQENLVHEHEGSTSEKISTAVVLEAEGAYSEYLLREIEDEWATQVPAIHGHLQALTNHGFTSITRDEYEQQLAKILRATIERNALRTVMQRLFAVSVLGFKVGGSNIVRFKCFYPTLAYEDAAMFYVHPGLHKVLSLMQREDPPQSLESKAVQS